MGIRSTQAGRDSASRQRDHSVLRKLPLRILGDMSARQPMDSAALMSSITSMSSVSSVCFWGNYFDGSSVLVIL